MRPRPPARLLNHLLRRRQTQRPQLLAPVLTFAGRQSRRGHAVLVPRLQKGLVGAQALRVTLSLLVQYVRV